MASRGDRTGLNPKMFEHQLLHSKPVIPSNKPTAELDDGLVSKNSRDNKTAIELFIAGVRAWEAGIRRRLGVG